MESQQQGCYGITRTGMNLKGVHSCTCKVRRGYSNSGVIPTICTLTAIFLPRQGSAELLWYHRIGWLTTMHNPYFSSCPPCCFEFELQCSEDNAAKFAERNYSTIPRHLREITMVLPAVSQVQGAWHWWLWLAYGHKIILSRVERIHHL